MCTHRYKYICVHIDTHIYVYPAYICVSRIHIHQMLRVCIRDECLRQGTIHTYIYIPIYVCAIPTRRTRKDTHQRHSYAHRYTHTHTHIDIHVCTYICMRDTRTCVCAAFEKIPINAEYLVTMKGVAKDVEDDFAFGYLDGKECEKLTCLSLIVCVCVCVCVCVYFCVRVCRCLWLCQTQPVSLVVSVFTKDVAKSSYDFAFDYGLATTCRLLKIIGLFCRI